MPSLRSASPRAVFSARHVEARGTERPPLFVLLGTFLLFFWRFGYAYAARDQDEFLPYLLHRLDPSLFASDWFVQTQTAFNVRMYFVLALQPLAEIFPLWLVMATVYAAAWLAIVHGLYRLAFTFTPDPLAASLATVLTLVATWMWTLGGNDLVYDILASELVAWALVLPALRLFFSRRWIFSGALLGAASLMQPLAGLLTAGALAGVLLFDLFQPSRQAQTLQALLRLIGTFALCAAPILIPLAFQQSAEAEPAARSPSAFYILAVFRAPHHYLPTTFPWADYAQFSVLLAAGLFALRQMQGAKRFRHARFIYRFLFIVTLVGLGTFVFTTLWPVLFVTQFQAFKLTVLAKALLVIALSAWIVLALPAALRERLANVLGWRRSGLALCAAPVDRHARRGPSQRRTSGPVARTARASGVRAGAGGAMGTRRDASVGPLCRPTLREFVSLRGAARYRHQLQSLPPRTSALARLVRTSDGLGATPAPGARPGRPRPPRQRLPHPGRPAEPGSDVRLRRRFSSSCRAAAAAARRAPPSLPSRSVDRL